MVYLILSILSSSGIFVTFKLIDRQAIPPLHAIIINYVTAFFLGLGLNLRNAAISFNQSLEWLWASVVIGVLFILMFLVVARSTQKAGVAVTTIASKMSVVFPILFSIVLEPGDVLTPLKGAGFLLALIAVLLTSWKNKAEKVTGHIMYLPLLLFIGMGVVDSMVKYAQFKYITNELSSIFSSITFLIAALVGILIFIFRKEPFKLLIDSKALIYGGMLGIFNFGSIYFIILTLNRAGKLFAMPESSIIFGLNNLGIVLLSVLVGIIAFRERISYINLSGIVLSIITIYLLMQV